MLIVDSLQHYAHDKVDLGGEAINVLALHVLQDGVHYVQVNEGSLFFLNSVICTKLDIKFSVCLYRDRFDRVG